MNRQKVDLLITKANELITLRGTSRKPVRKYGMVNLGIIENGAVAVDEQKIIAADKTSRVEQRFKPERTVDASGKIVMPGFVDSHTHLIFADAREEEFELRLKGLSYMEILARGGGILKTVRETRKASKEQLVEDGRRTLDTMLKHGTTTVEAKSGYGLTVKDEVKCLEAAEQLNKTHPIDVVSTFLGAHAVPTSYAGRTNDYVKLITEKMIPKVAEERLAEFCDVFCEEGVFEVDHSRKILETGKKYGLKPKIHADEFTDAGGAKLAAEVEAVSADHLLFSSEIGLKALAQKGVVAVLLPTASFTLMTRKYAEARRLIEMDVPVALGTDFNPSCWTENMQMSIVFACREMRLTPAEAIVGATINAAHAIDHAEEVGSLEPGKKADITVLNIPNHKFLGYRFGVNLVDIVVTKGRIVVDAPQQT